MRDDKTQELLNQMAAVQIMETISRTCADHVLQVKAKALNKGKVTMSMFYRRQLIGESAYCAIAAGLGSPPADVTLH